MADNVAGAAAGAAVGVVVAGTAIYLLTGANIESTHDALATSRLAPEVSRATLVSSLKPWCWQIEGESGAACTDIMGLFNQYLGGQISDTAGDILGDDAGSILGVVQNTLSGSPEELTSLNSAQEENAEQEQQAAVFAETDSGPLPWHHRPRPRSTANNVAIR